LGVGARAERLLLKRTEREFGAIDFVRQLVPIEDRRLQLQKRTGKRDVTLMRYNEYCQALRKKNWRVY